MIKDATVLSAGGGEYKGVRILKTETLMRMRQDETTPEIRELARRIHAAGSVAELECYEVGHVEEALRLAAEGAIAAPLHFQFVLGVPGGLGADERHPVPGLR